MKNKNFFKSKDIYILFIICFGAILLWVHDNEKLKKDWLIVAVMIIMAIIVLTFIKCTIKKNTLNFNTILLILPFILFICIYMINIFSIKRIHHIYWIIPSFIVSEAILVINYKKQKTLCFNKALWLVIPYILVSIVIFTATDQSDIKSLIFKQNVKNHLIYQNGYKKSDILNIDIIRGRRNYEDFVEVRFIDEPNVFYTYILEENKIFQVAVNVDDGDAECGHIENDNIRIYENNGGNGYE
ncbi:hypothetical protein OW763_01920 [Clostridium aestuarii]|uniref:Uncharacterized protein n=1 Tax=Clostridium aestuarii TaxID=338193 RepID=A0ABT4CVU9_9CLOT|nr:DUF3139 domain-containing protein [Clostridium aestuarii]MCY6483111.1 hypothetical protein [Clostridium aestuarii]